MRPWIILSAFAFSSGCASISQPPQPPIASDFNSEDFRQRLAVKQNAALKAAAASGSEVKRLFIVGVEMHHGIFLTSLTPYPSDIGLPYHVMPDFVNDDMQAKFLSAMSQEAMSKHVGQRLMCECVGVEWSFHGTNRFFVRQAELRWEQSAPAGDVPDPYS
ncbi:hypothetical protein BWQ93_15905 [Sphingopyxis sp. QXT-31]|uniref:hypothetical protein n=1 Tax=Sphingopyxis sp. QXT-31 TaxID=1357916 RepID=UPI0009797050|nr:hypothetical protein [Sphingopyxis sp. QXT-31]APZ99803.1 hypothetical protein BWQ93_15905 [Sphingopyxis sp. QXT-31]